MSQRDTEVDQDVAPEPMPKSATAMKDPVVDPEPAPGNFAGTVSDVDIQSALSEGGEPSQAADEPVEDVVDVLRPKAEPHEWVFGPEDRPLVYIQRPLSFIQKMQWFSLVGGVLDKAMSGPNPVSVNELLSAPGDARSGFNMADFRDADTFVRAIGKLIVHAPTFLTDSYCIWLGVPDHQKDVAVAVMSRPEYEGGLSDDQGLEIIEVFIDQNYEALADFFGDKIGALQARVAKRQAERSQKKADLA